MPTYLAVHIESKMIIFTSGLLQGFRLFSGKFCTRLCFRLEKGCAALKVQSPRVEPSDILRTFHRRVSVK